MNSLNLGKFSKSREQSSTGIICHFSRDISITENRGHDGLFSFVFSGTRKT